MTPKILKDKSHTANISVEVALQTIIVYSSVFFVLGYLSEIYIYLKIGNSTLAVLDTVCLSITISLGILWRRKKIDSENTLLISMFIVAINLFITILYKGFLDNHDTPERILFCMYLFIIPVIFTTITKMKIAPYIIASMAITSYLIVAITTNNPSLFTYMPMLFLIYIGAPILLNMLIIALQQIERDRIDVMEEQQKFFKKMNIEQEHIDLIIASDIRNKKEADLILKKMNKKIRDTLVEKVRDAINSEENIKAILKNRLPDITESELEISVMIIEGKTVSEICEIRHVSPSTITSTRSRLRKKLELAENEILKSYLISIVNESISNN